MKRIEPTPPVNKNSKLEVMIIGEAPGADEEKSGEPFCGYSGKLLNSMLSQAHIAREDCYLTNVFLERPYANKIENFCVSSKKEAQDLWEHNYDGKYPLGYMTRGKYLKPEYVAEVYRVQDEIVKQNPNIVVLLGNTPLWAITGLTGISKYRGTIMEVELQGKTFKVLPTFHPAYILRKYDDLPVAIADMQKVSREKGFSEIRRVYRNLWIEPDLNDIKQFIKEVVNKSDYIACDIETTAKAGGQITCIGFGTTQEAICIPFMDLNSGEPNYWATPEEECEALKLVNQILSTDIRIIGQNFMYDMAWLWMKWGMYPKPKSIEDTMLMQHSLYCEMEKGLGFLGSVYTNEVAWKNLAAKTNKKDS